MGYYDEPDNVADYIEMADGCDGAEIVAVLERHVPAGATVLEIGMGPGKDLELLSRSYSVTGSDSSQVFLDLYRARDPEADLLLLDVRSLDTSRSWDALYSNKVLHHLTRDELARSLRRQAEILTPGGYVLHSFWPGSGEERHAGLLFIKYREAELEALFEPGFEIIEIGRYRDLVQDDSIYVVARRQQAARAAAG